MATGHRLTVSLVSSLRHARLYARLTQALVEVEDYHPPDLLELRPRAREYPERCARDPPPGSLRGK